MTDPTRGARIRRSGSRRGWFLMTVLLVLAICASSALVFTSRVELLKLAVILALWAAVVAAFVSVIYRRQSDSDQAKVRDLKLVYDLQLDREISARREYELTVESHLRRELAAELRAQSADEVAALRAELAALRANLEYIFDTDLSHRPAIETDHSRAESMGGWPSGPLSTETTGRVSSSRIDTEDLEDVHEDEDFDGHAPDTVESPIIDVPAEPHPPEDEWAREAAEHGGAHRRAAQQWGPPPPPAPHQQPAPPPSSPQPGPQFPWLPPTAPAPSEPQPAAPAGMRWQPAPAEGQWIPAGEPGSNWVAPESQQDTGEYVGRRRAPDSGAPTPPEPPRGRHLAEAESAGPSEPEPEPEPQPEFEAEEPEQEDGDGGAHTGGQSVAELLARLQATPSGGGRRRRREE
ncbi:DUF6779 domain-containing protein [Mycolicibacterium chubuense]|nr:DUF6779 domain-containing protein [Mycolicibacterium chubuense]